MLLMHLGPRPLNQLHLFLIVTMASKHKSEFGRLYLFQNASDFYHFFYFICLPVYLIKSHVYYIFVFLMWEFKLLNSDKHWVTLQLTLPKMWQHKKFSLEKSFRWNSRKKIKNIEIIFKAFTIRGKSSLKPKISVMIRHFCWFQIPPFVQRPFLQTNH